MTELVSTVPERIIPASHKIEWSCDVIGCQRVGYAMSHDLGEARMTLLQVGFTKVITKDSTSKHYCPEHKEMEHKEMGR